MAMKRFKFIKTLFYRLFLEPGACIMERGMLLGLKKRVERASAKNAGRD